CLPSWSSISLSVARCCMVSLLRDELFAIAQYKSRIVLSHFAIAQAIVMIRFGVPAVFAISFIHIETSVLAATSRIFAVEDPAAPELKAGSSRLKPLGMTSQKIN